MKIDILSLFPDMFHGFLNTSIIKRAIEEKIVDLTIHDFREFSKDKHKKVDDYPYGGGQGMVLMCQPIVDCLNSLKTSNSYTILMSPQGKTWNQKEATRVALDKKHVIIICGHYEGFDERTRDYVDLEVSIGDYILTGGELASMVMSDSIIRLLEGTIRKDSHIDDSFSNDLLEYPQYTKPRVYEGKSVPEVLLNGHHEYIRKFRLKESLRKTYLRRPELLKNRYLSKEEEILFSEIEIEEKKS